MPETSAGGVRVVLTTASSREEALRLADALVAERRAACVNVVPQVTSVYEWEGVTRHSSELLLVIKTTEASLAGLEQRIVELHSYDVPEMVVIPVHGGHRPYLEWVLAGSGGPA